MDQEGPKMTIGSNSESAARLGTIIERIERIRADKKQCTLDEAQVVAEAKADGFFPPAIKAVIKIRAMKPHQRQEAEAILDTYLHAMGMADEPPLFRQIGRIGADITSRDSIVSAMEHLVPQDGSITIETKDGKPVKLTRDKDGTVTITDVLPPAPAPKGAKGSKVEGRRAPARPEPPAVDADGAEDLGREAYKANTPIIDNPFPYGDARRGRWDAGYRKESGGDGMGPDRDD